MRVLAMLLAGLASTPEEDPGTLAPVEAAGGQGAGLVAASDSGYLAAWLDPRSGYASIVAQRLSTGGAPLDSTGLMICAESWTFGPVGMASNGADYLVAWADSRPDGGIYAARVLPNGTLDPYCGRLLSSSLSVYTTLRVLFDGEQYVVAWRATTNTIRTVRVRPDGIPIDPGGQVVVGATEPLYLGLAPAPAGFSLAWIDREIPTHLKVVTFDRDGGQRDLPPRVTTTSATNIAFLKSFTATPGGGLVVLDDSSRAQAFPVLPDGGFGTPQLSLFLPTGLGVATDVHLLPGSAGGQRVLARLADDGTLAGPLLPFTAPGASMPFGDDALALRGDDVLVFYGESLGPPIGPGVRAVLLSDAGAPPATLSMSAPAASTPVLSAAGGSSLLIWREEGTWAAQVFSSDGGRADSPLGPLLNDAGATLALSTGQGAAHLVVWAVGGALYASWWDAAAQPSTAPVLVSAIGGAYPLQVSAGDDRALLLVGANGRFLFPDGGVSSQFPVVDQYRAAIAFSGEFWDVVWLSAPAPPVARVTRVHLDGSLEWPGGLQLQSSTQNVREIAALRWRGETLVSTAAADGTDAWSVLGDGGALHFHRVTGTGLVLGSALADTGARVVHAWVVAPIGGRSGAFGRSFDANLDAIEPTDALLFPESLPVSRVQLVSETGALRAAYLRFVREPPYGAIRLRTRLALDDGGIDVIDAGANDGGGTGDGGTETRSYRVACGCQGAPEASVLLAALCAFSARARRSRRARQRTTSTGFLQMCTSRSATLPSSTRDTALRPLFPTTTRS